MDNIERGYLQTHPYPQSRSGTFPQRQVRDNIGFGGVDFGWTNKPPLPAAIP